MFYSYYLLYVLCSGGHKGYGLAMMVDMFCGILSGSAFGPNVRQWQGHNERLRADLVNRGLCACWE